MREVLAMRASDALASDLPAFFLRLKEFSRETAKSAETHPRASALVGRDWSTAHD
jgi:hypothetical protein